MRNLETAQLGFSFAAFERTLFADLDSGMNACVACCDRWADLDLDGLEWVGRDGATTVRGFAARCAHRRRPFRQPADRAGVGLPGDVVAGNPAARGAEMLTVILGTWRAGAVYQPIATGLSEVAIEARINTPGGHRRSWWSRTWRTGELLAWSITARRSWWSRMVRGSGQATAISWMN